MAVTSYTPTKNYPAFSTLVYPSYTVSTVTTASAVTYTAAQILGGLILRDTNGAGRSDIFPTAALLLAAVEGAQYQSSPVSGNQATGFLVTIRNTADANETITMTAGTGVTISGTATIGQNNQKSFLIVFTNTTSGSEAYTAYSMGTVTF